MTEDEALADYEAERYAALAPIFDVTCRLAALPPADEFVALQKELSRLIEAEALWLAGLPALHARPAVSLAAA